MGLPLKKPNAHLTLREKERILTLKDKGHGPSAIWRKTEIPRSIISSFLNRHVKTDNSTLVRKPGSGAKKKLSARAKRALVRITVNDPRMTLKALSTPFKSGKQLNYYIVTKILKRYNKAKRQSRKKPYLTIRYKKLRRVHSRFELKIKRNPRKVIWLDEVTFEIGEDLINFWVTRGLGRDEEYIEKNLKLSFKSGRVTVGAWDCFC